MFTRLFVLIAVFIALHVHVVIDKVKMFVDYRIVFIFSFQMRDPKVWFLQRWLNNFCQSEYILVNNSFCRKKKMIDMCCNFNFIAFHILENTFIVICYLRCLCLICYNPLILLIIIYNSMTVTWASYSYSKRETCEYIQCCSRFNTERDQRKGVILSRKIAMQARTTGALEIHVHVVS